MANRKPRVVVIGLDLGDGELIRRWAADGALPNLRRLMEQGSSGPLGTPAEWLHVSAWPTLYTGVPVGYHGVYYTFQPAPGLQGYRRFARDQYGAPTVWQLLSEAGVRCTVFDAPYTEPEPTAARQIIDWGSWAQYWKSESVPRALLGELNRAVGKYPLGLEAHDLGLVGRDPVELQPRLLRSAHAKTDAILWLMNHQECDCFITVYGETHPGGHYCWWPDQPGASGAADLSLLKSLYREIDAGVGRIIDALPDDATVMIVSGDSVGPNHSGWHLLPDVLRRLGVLAEPAAQPEPQDQSANRDDAPRPGWDPVRALRDLLPKDFRKALARKLPTALRDRLARRVDTAAIDWSRTRAYTLPTDLEGCIRINLAGREPFGIVQPGTEYEQLCDELTAALRELTNPATGRPAVRDVVRGDRQFPGPRRDYLPDLIVLWSAEAPIAALASDRIGTVEGASPDGRTGTHTPPGFLIARGPAFSPGDRAATAGVSDIAPTLLALFGVEPPAQMDGTALIEAVPLTHDRGDHR
ncbi:MAG TPA: alkaline phosphatase family protein [Gemmatimonadales bacterium]|nr:alkaline phosphatase family protein [Gemmatimonadales bacterium]